MYTIKMCKLMLNYFHITISTIRWLWVNNTTVSCIVCEDSKSFELILLTNSSEHFFLERDYGLRCASQGGLLLDDIIMDVHVLNIFLFTYSLLFRKVCTLQTNRWISKTGTTQNENYQK